MITALGYGGWPSFIVLTVILGGGIAWMTGRAVAGRWQSPAKMAGYCVLLACALRFLHYALFQEELLSGIGFASDLCVLLLAGTLGWRLRRVAQMTRQYGWQYERTGLFSWRERQGP